MPPQGEDPTERQTPLAEFTNLSGGDSNNRDAAPASLATTAAPASAMEDDSSRAPASLATSTGNMDATADAALEGGTTVVAGLTREDAIAIGDDGKPPAEDIDHSDEDRDDADGDDARPLDTNGNPMDDDDQGAAGKTLAKIAEDRAAAKAEAAAKGNGRGKGRGKEKMETKRGSRGIVDLDGVKASAKAWVQTLFLNEGSKEAVLQIIDDFTYWDEQFSSHTMVRKLRKSVEMIGTVEARLKNIADDDDHFMNHHLRCQIIAIAAMVDSDGISLPSQFYTYRTGKDVVSKDWVQMLTQLQGLLHWEKNQRVRAPYMRGLAEPYVAPPPPPRKQKGTSKRLTQIRDEERAEQEAKRAKHIAQSRADLQAYKDEHGTNFNVEDVSEDALEDMGITLNSNKKKRRGTTVATAVPQKTAVASSSKTTVAKAATKKTAVASSSKATVAGSSKRVRSPPRPLKVRKRSRLDDSDEDGEDV